MIKNFLNKYDIDVVFDIVYVIGLLIFRTTLTKIKNTGRRLADYLLNNFMRLQDYHQFLFLINETLFVDENTR